MRKSTGIVKRLLALFLVVLMSIESFGAVVSDNDGSAFITKAEFDSLKNDFQSQIDQYNTSIDAKVDGAIASYLAGINLAKQYSLTNMLVAATNAGSENVGFVNWRADVPTGKNVVDLQAGFMLAAVYGADQGNNAGSTSGLWCYEIISNVANWAGEFSYNRYKKLEDTDQPAGTTEYWWVNFPFARNDNTDYIATGDTTNWSLETHMRKRCEFFFKAEKIIYQSGRALNSITRVEDVPWDTYPTFLADATTSPAAKQPGQWTAPAVSMGITGLNISPNCGLTHSWYNVDASDDTNYEFLDFMYNGTVTGNAVSVNYSYRDYYHSSTQITVRCQSHVPVSDSSYGGWPGIYWGYRLGNRQIGKHPSAYAVSDNNHNFWFKYNRQKVYTLDWDHLTNEYYDKLFSSPYYKYQGIPICKVDKPGKIKLKLKFTNKKISDGSALSPTTASYTYAIMDKKFKNGDLPTLTETDSYYIDGDGYNHVLRREERNTGTAEWITDWIEISKEKIIDSVNGDYIYIKVAPNKSDQVVTVGVDGDIILTEET